VSIAEVVDHLYVIKARRERIVVFFRTSHMGPFAVIFLVVGLCIFTIWAALRLGWSGSVVSGIVGGSISVVATLCFAMAEHVTRFAITIESDSVALQRDFQGIPVGAKKTYARSIVSDLGMYPHVNPRAADPVVKWGRLCLWAEGKSIQLEPMLLPISEGFSLANDLRKLGIEFPRTFDAFDKVRLSPTTLDNFSYFSF
jgi:hypothetical protein